MLKLLYAPTTAGMKALLILEELQLSYSSLPINVVKKVHLSETYKKIVPTIKIPALIDDNKLYFESGAILYHLAKKHNKLIPENNQHEVLSWFFWDTSELSPKFLQHYKARLLDPNNIEIHIKIEESIKNLLNLLDIQLENKSYVATEFSIADISCYTWLNYYVCKNLISNLIADFTNIQKWLSQMNGRDATKKTTEMFETFDWDSEITEEELKKFINN